jgi:hypothetical protein
MCLFINFNRKPFQNWFTVENSITLLSTHKLARLTLFRLRQSGCMTKAHLLLGLEPSDI